MATPLHWKAYQLHEYIYGNLYCHIVSMDITKEMFKIEKNPKKLFPFFLATGNLFINLFASLYIIVKFSYAQISMPVYLIIIHTWFATLLILTHGLNYLSYRYGHEFGEDSFAHLFKFDRKLRKSNISVDDSLNVKWIPVVLAGNFIYIFLIFLKKLV